jgi:hypothetical protein
MRHKLQPYMREQPCKNSSTLAEACRACSNCRMMQGVGVSACFSAGVLLFRTVESLKFKHTHVMGPPSLQRQQACKLTAALSGRKARGQYVAAARLLTTSRGMHK